MLSRLVIIGAFIFWGSIVSASTERHNCFSIDKPTTIETDGCYLLKNNIIANDSDGLIIKASNVVLDLNGFAISAASDNTYSGIYAVGVSNVEIKNGSISGFLYGVRVFANIGASEISVVGTEITGRARGISIEADTVRIKNNLIYDVKGYHAWPQAHSVGVEVFSQNCEIISNTVKNIFPYSAAEAIPISLSSAPRRCTVINNVIINDRQPRVGRSIGLWLGEISESPDHIEISENYVSGFTYGLMAYPSYFEYVNENTFLVDCDVRDMHSMEALYSNNIFSDSGLICRDTIDYLKSKSNHGYEWEIRLAVALFELQRSLLTAPKYFSRLLEAESILEPLVSKYLLAKEQMVRLKSLKSVVCK